MADDRERGSSRGGSTKSGATDFVSRFRDWRNEVLSRDNGPAGEVCPARLWVIIADVTFWNWKESSAPARRGSDFSDGTVLLLCGGRSDSFQRGKKTLCRTDTSRTSAHIDLRNARAFHRFFFTPPRRRQSILYYYYVESIIIILLLLRTVFTCTRFTTTVTIAARRRSLSGHRKLLQNVKSLNFFLSTHALISLNCHVRITRNHLTSYIIANRTDSARDFPTTEVVVVMALDIELVYYA